jgi:23S rRNA (uridine2552-2'-O)-methyltransferase
VAVKKVQDYYFKKAKKDKYPARSIYKLEEAQKKHRLLRRGESVLDLGACPGSWSLYAAKEVGAEGLVVGVDLKSWQAASREGARIHSLCGDIYAQDTVDRIRELRAHYRVVISDMAPQTTGNKLADHQRSLDLARRALELATEFLEPRGNFYCKVFEGEDFKEFVNQVRGRFTTVKIVKPKSSRSESREVFVLGMGYKRIP